MRETRKVQLRTRVPRVTKAVRFVAWNKSLRATVLSEKTLQIDIATKMCISKVTKTLRFKVSWMRTQAERGSSKAMLST